MQKDIIKTTIRVDATLWKQMQALLTIRRESLKSLFEGMLKKEIDESEHKNIILQLGEAN